MECLAIPDDLLRYRSEFPIVETSTYLISNSLGAMPRGVYDALHQYADTGATRGGNAWEESWWMLAAEVGIIRTCLQNPGGHHPAYAQAFPVSPLFLKV